MKARRVVDLVRGMDAAEAVDMLKFAQQVADHYGVAAYIHPEDRQMLADPAKGLSLDLSAMLKDMTFTEPAEVVEVFDGDTLRFGSMTFDVDHAPGHSPGSVSFRITVQTEEGPRMVVLGGDVLFQDGVGRTDLPAGDTEVLMQSIAKKFLVLDDDASPVLAGVLPHPAPHGGAAVAGVVVGGDELINPSTRERLEDLGAEVVLEGIHAALRAGNALTARIGGRDIGLHHRLSPRQVDMVLAGGRIPLTAKDL